MENVRDKLALSSTKRTKRKVYKILDAKEGLNNTWVMVQGAKRWQVDNMRHERCVERRSDWEKQFYYVNLLNIVEFLGYSGPEL